MNLLIFDDAGWRDLLPLTWLRSAAELRCGRDRLLDKLETHTGLKVRALRTRPALQPVLAERLRFPTPDAEAPWCLINSRALLTGDVTPPALGTRWVRNGDLLAATVAGDALEKLAPDTFQTPAALVDWVEPLAPAAPPAALRLVRYPWEPALANPDELRRQCATGGEIAGELYPGVHLVNEGAITVAAGATVKPGVVLDAEAGPILIEAGAQLQANAVIEGPCCVGPRAIVRPGAVLREGTTIGPVCKVGGEVECSIIHGYSNKQHDGFLGHSYIGEWVNLGADTITSDLKNTYGAIRVFLNGSGVESGQQFVGSIIGDHSKTGIGTILPTGCVIGMMSNVFTPQSVPKFVPSFAWLTEGGMTEYRLEKAVSIARTVMARRDFELSTAAANLLETLLQEARRIEEPGWRLDT